MPDQVPVRLRPRQRPTFCSPPNGGLRIGSFVRSGSLILSLLPAQDLPAPGSRCTHATMSGDPALITNTFMTTTTIHRHIPPAFADDSHRSESGSESVVIEQRGSVVLDRQVKFADGCLDSPGYRMVTHQAQRCFEGKSGGEQPVHHYLVDAPGDPEMILRLAHGHRRRVACVPGRGTAHRLYCAGLIQLYYRHAEGRCCVHRWHLGSYPAVDRPCRQGPGQRGHLHPLAWRRIL
jgi:hypothetical protein